MKRIHIVGGKNHGKTTLVVELVTELTGRGLSIGTIKHTHHQHELDVPGKDSHRHRQAGANVVGILTRSLNAVFWSHDQAPAIPATGDTRYDRFAPMFAVCDLVIVEGDTQTSAPKLEVWRAERGTAPLADRLTGVLAIVSDDQPPGDCLVLPRSRIELIAGFILERIIA